MSLVKPPPKKAKTATLQVQIDEEVRQKLDLYAAFIGSSPSYVVAEALKCTSGSEREFTLEGSWYADEEIQAGANRNAAAAD